MSLAKEIAARLATIAQVADEWRTQHRVSALMAHPSADPVLDIDQAAAYAALCPKTLKTDALAGKLATLQRSGAGRVRVRLSDLNAYLNDQRRAALAAGKTSNNQEINWAL